MEKYCPTCKKNFPGSETECPDDGTPLIASQQRDLTGEVLDKRYEVMGKIGNGGMGVVYRARQRMINRVVALKVLRHEISADNSAVQRFLNEATATASLKNSHTVTLYDFGVTHDGQLYYTMELLDGLPLSQVIRSEGALDYRRAADLILQSCESLEEAHANGILHRDIKPDNIFVIEERGKPMAKVLDFGIAKLLNQTDADSLTQTGMVCGTPKYLSPEQVQGDTACPASDLYSLAVVFYEMLTGSPPFEAATPMRVMLKHLQEEPESLIVRNPEVVIPKALDAFVRKAMNKRPSSRYPSVTVFREALLEALEDHDTNPRSILASSITISSTGVRGLAGTESSPTAPHDCSVLGVTPPDSPEHQGISSQPESVGPDGVLQFQPTTEQAVAVNGSGGISPTAELVSAPWTSQGPVTIPNSATGGTWKIVTAVVMTLLVVSVGLLVWRPWAKTTSVTNESPAAAASGPSIETSQQPGGETPPAPVATSIAPATTPLEATPVPAPSTRTQVPEGHEAALTRVDEDGSARPDAPVRTENEATAADAATDQNSLVNQAVENKDTPLEVTTPPGPVEPQNVAQSPVAPAGSPAGPAPKTSSEIVQPHVPKERQKGHSRAGKRIRVADSDKGLGDKKTGGEGKSKSQAEPTTPGTKKEADDLLMLEKLPEKPVENEDLGIEIEKLPSRKVVR